MSLHLFFFLNLKDEFHSRLRFNRRGLVAMANAGPHDNGSQFFFTLGRADELNNKHTIFGKVNISCVCVQSVSVCVRKLLHASTQFSRIFPSFHEHYCFFLNNVSCR